MHVIDPTNPLYGGDGSLEDVSPRELVVLNALAKQWPDEVPQPEIFKDSGLSKEEFGNAVWEPNQIGFALSEEMGWEADIKITKKGYSLFQNNNPVFEDVRPTTVDKVNVYGNMNQSAVATGRATASVITQNGPISSQNLAIGNGASIHIDSRTFLNKVIDEINNHPSANEKEKEEAKGMLAKIAEHPLTSTAIGAVLGSLL